MSEPTQFPDPIRARILPRACGSAGAILATISRSDLDQPTPCASWKVRDVVNHILGGAAYFAELAGRARLPTARRRTRTSRPGTSPARSAARPAAWPRPTARPGVLDKDLEMPMGAMPGSVWAWIAASDIFAHGWDLAKATGQPTALEPELAQLLLARVTQTLPDAMRGPEGEAPFGPEVKMAGSAPPADQLAAFLGRQP